jgi:hypothetical protein
MHTSRDSSTQHLSVYRATVKEAAANGAALMGRLVAAAARVLYEREITARSLRERDILLASSKLLGTKGAEMAALYPKALLLAFSGPESSKGSDALNRAEVHFDELELMDEAQVQTSVVIARVQQVAMLATDSSLADLNTMICGSLGLRSVLPDSNPLRPEAYVSALHSVLDQVDVSAHVRMEWLACMSPALGAELNAMYRDIANQLRRQGVPSAGYAVMQTFAGPGSGAVANRTVHEPANTFGQVSVPAAVREGGKDEAVLTLATLRRLLAGELGEAPPQSRTEAFAQQFAREFEGDDSPSPAPVADFDATVPAAFEALTEMRQVAQVVERLQQRKGSKPGPQAESVSSVVAIRDSLRQTATGVAQALSLEVVTLMVDNMARNPRLLEPIQQLIADLEPALLLLSLADPRFFSDKQHPARELLQEITHRSLAFESVESAGFDDFLKLLEQALEPLGSDVIESAEPFERVLSDLRERWHVAAREQDLARDEAVRVLQHAEQRNLLAQKIASDIHSHPDSSSVPEVVINFLCGPWAQVVAQARIAGGSASNAAAKYQALISAMLWSTHPELTRNNFAKLTRLVPLLINTLREGLETIHYPAVKTSAFLEALMGLHQLAFRAGTAPLEKDPASATVQLPAQSVGERKALLEDSDPWIAPAEAEASNFMELPELAAHGPGAPQVPIQVEEVIAETSLEGLPLGSWVEIWTNANWMRTQLTWASPHGTLFLFTSVFGTTQSMTKRSRDKLVAAGHLRRFSGQTVVDGALDAVAKIAMRNSMDTTI